MLRVEVAHHEDAWVLVDYLKERVEGEGIRREVGLHDHEGRVTSEVYADGDCFERKKG